MKRWGLAGAFLVALALAAPWAGPAGAAQVGERIRAFDSTIEIEPAGTLRVTEKIQYDFASNEKHGIFRDIPVRFDYEPDHRYERRTTIDEVSVQAGPGTPDNLKVEDAGRFVRFRIGDPDTTISGVHTYTITYRVRGALNAFEDHDELFWNVTGNEWPVSIAAVSAVVQSPGGVSQVACYAGPTGSRLACASASAGDGPGATFTHHDLSSHEGLTIVVGMPKGTVTVPPPILDERWAFDRAFSLTPGTVVLSGGLMAVIVLGLVRLFGRGRDRRWAGSPVDAVFGNRVGREEAVPLFERSHDPVEFEPPDKVRPGQVGTLIDEVANPLDVTATIIDLAVRGYLRIEEIPKEGWFGKADWRLVKLKDPDGLRSYERKLHNGLFQSGDAVELSDLKRKFAPRLREVQTALYDDAVKEGWFPNRPDTVRMHWRIIGVLAVIAAFVVAIVLAAVSRLGLVGVPLLIGSIALLAGAGRMPRRTAKGWATLRRVHGFRQFIEQSEKERARFAERANLFSEYLPYAIVFGCTEKWARAFDGLDTEVAAYTGAWYMSSHPFAIGSFSHSVEGFATTTSGTIVATAASSGSSGFGGGSSGGGFGGGGGGSW